MSTVYTIRGLLDRSELHVRELASECDNARVVATEWHHKGELVRRDVHVIVLRPPSIGVDHGE